MAADQQCQTHEINTQSQQNGLPQFHGRVSRDFLRVGANMLAIKSPAAFSFKAFVERGRRGCRNARTGQPLESSEILLARRMAAPGTGVLRPERGLSQTAACRQREVLKDSCVALPAARCQLRQLALRPKAAEGRRTPRRTALTDDPRTARQRLGVRQPSGAFEDRTPPFQL
jgi:hypothetical protein